VRTKSSFAKSVNVVAARTKDWQLAEPDSIVVINLDTVTQ
jgi:hypothetical protein